MGREKSGYNGISKRLIHTKIFLETILFYFVPRFVYNKKNPLGRREV